MFPVARGAAVHCGGSMLHFWHFGNFFSSSLHDLGDEARAGHGWVLPGALGTFDSGQEDESWFLSLYEGLALFQELLPHALPQDCLWANAEHPRRCCPELHRLITAISLSLFFHIKGIKSSWYITSELATNTEANFEAKLESLPKHRARKPSFTCFLSFKSMFYHLSLNMPSNPILHLHQHVQPQPHWRFLWGLPPQPPLNAEL